MSEVNAEQNITNSFKLLQEIRAYDGPEVGFWDKYTEALIALSQSHMAIVITRNIVKKDNWQVVNFAPKDNQFNDMAKNLKDNVTEAAEECAQKGFALFEENGDFVGALYLKSNIRNQIYLAIVHFGELSRIEAEAKLEVLKSMGDIPADFQYKKSAKAALLVHEHFGNTLDLMVVLNEKEKFLATAMTFCNELAARFKCDRVCLGWQQKGYVRLLALSHADNFEKKMEASQKLELAMEEALDQDREIVLPSLIEGSVVTRDHEDYTRSQNTEFVCSVPLRVNDEAVAVCTLERNTEAFSEGEIQLLRLSCDQAVRRLNDLKENDKWIGALITAKMRKQLSKLFGFEYTWAKAIGIVLVIALGFMAFYPISHRLDSTVILRTSQVNYLSAPFDGHIEEVNAQAGDLTQAKTTLMSLNKSDLLLEQTGLMAEMNRYQRESEKAMANKALADMQVAEAQYDQASAKLEIVKFKLSQADIQSTYAGVIVEGDLKERIGAPVKQGDVLFKIARLDSMYTVIEVSESDIHYLTENQTGEIALTSNPEYTFPIKVFRQEPAAVVKEEGNVFLVHAAFTDQTPNWFRPGMTGIAKLNNGKKTLLWIITRKTIDFIRMKLWF